MDSHLDGPTSTPDGSDPVPFEAFSLVTALRSELFGRPPALSESPMAILAFQLAQLIDQGIRVPECSREFRQCMTELKAMASGAWRDDVLDQLQAKRDNRRKG
jgi:hypothetical protein